MERVKACRDTGRGGFPWREGDLQAAESARSRVPAPGALADSPVVAGKLPRIAAVLTDSRGGDGGVTLDGDGIVGNDRTT